MTGAPLVGIDLLEPERLARNLERNPELRSELFHPGELAYAESRHDPSQSLASRYAAKEAVVKALGLDGWDPLEIEILGGGENTALRLHGEARKRAEQLGVEVTISMTHLSSLAGAIALARPAPDT
jgi:holo-[acyl-carrier protein] synthase